MNFNNKRIFAFLIDLLIIATISSLFSGFFEIERALGTTTIFDQTVTYGISWSFLFYAMYFIIFDIFNDAITVGKQLLKIKVVLKNDNPLSLRAQIYRTVLKTISILFLPISAFVFLINGKTLQDSYCNTKTVENSFSFTN
ncbi:RDD family protein [Aequorivita sp. F47161]|uniref:RDD family protein n=1 Tax=Aequorivita vitellina TaxID=2874475 RepID=A0A9X1U262_9FLAO|nr:RDD family protein [Aequorivita vitellina]MCG2417932.1 RDD family protein [Aequorivita vitellina]